MKPSTYLFMILTLGAAASDLSTIKLIVLGLVLLGSLELPYLKVYDNNDDDIQIQVLTEFYLDDNLPHTSLHDHVDTETCYVLMRLIHVTKWKRIRS